MERTVNSIVYIYIFICIALLTFNLMYIFTSGRIKRIRHNKAVIWKQEILNSLKSLEQTGYLNEDHQYKMKKKLLRIEEMMAYNQAVQQIMFEFPQKNMQHYFDCCHSSFQLLAISYAKRNAMERGFMAYLISLYHPNGGNKHDLLIEVLLTYFEHSTVYCRENVLRALYAMGSITAIEKAFALLSDRGWYHHPRLIADGMGMFKGNQVELIHRLWMRADEWNEELTIAVVQFASNVSGTFSEVFFTALKNQQTPIEIRFALLRYFQHHRYEPVRPLLIKYVLEQEESSLAVTAAATLSKYPGKDTENALRIAMQSGNWYVRRNVATSLVELGVAENAIGEVRKSGNRYGAEMLEYISGVDKRSVNPSDDL